MNAERSLDAAERHRGEPQAGGPALGALVQQLDVGGRQVQRELLVEQLLGLAGAELQLGRADLDQLARRAQPGERERRVDAGGDRDLQVARRVLEQERDRAVDELVVQLVVVVEHEHDAVGQLGELVDQPREHHGVDRRPGVRQRGEHAAAEPGQDRAQGGDDVAPEAHGVVVRGIERDPRERPVGALRPPPLGEHGRLAPAGGRADEHQPPAHPRRQLDNKLVARHVALVDIGGVELRGSDLHAGCDSRRAHARLPTSPGTPRQARRRGIVFTLRVGAPPLVITSSRRADTLSFLRMAARARAGSEIVTVRLATFL